MKMCPESRTIDLGMCFGDSNYRDTIHRWVGNCSRRGIPQGQIGGTMSPLDICSMLSTL